MVRIKLLGGKGGSSHHGLISYDHTLRYNIRIINNMLWGEKYFWCYTGGSKWDYCSPEPTSTEEVATYHFWWHWWRYMFWPELSRWFQLLMTLVPIDILTRTFQITSKGGWTCNGVCSKMASSYNFCEIRGKASFFEKSWWDFCTPKWTTKNINCQ